MNFTRRQLGFGLGSIAFAGLAARLIAQAPVAGMNEVTGYGPLVPDPDNLIDLPKGFDYRVISRLGNIMDDGFLVPNAADGMGAIDMGNGKVALVRNHELSVDEYGSGPFTGMVPPDLLTYDRMADDKSRPLPGGTTTLVYDMKTGQREAEWLSLSGTIRNCSGGITPWGSWLSCEENVTRAGKGVGKDHGYVFEVSPRTRGLVDPVPLKDMGRFNHEAACVDPRTGIAYLTEDRGDGLLYRFLPNQKGDYAKGGRLEALAFVEAEITDSRNWAEVQVGKGRKYKVRWVPLSDPESPNDDLRKQGAAKGAALFARGEGIFWGKGELFFACTNGGAAKYGQIFRYVPSVNEGTANENDAPGLIDLYMESTDPAFYNYGDNLAVMPNGHLLVCEDQYTDISANHLRGVNGKGQTYMIAKSRIQTEFAGGCFSPDGTTLFVNLYEPAMTLAIKGPWGRVSG
ncbi:MAG: alkaline phosphatase PhoX [Sphingorhabdus sp.]|uniref:alkaline phosphatase PhoX n=1 Tax=Sphingorhabdus sp. TaxID=1902408 RepID=UPI0038FD252A